MEKELEQQFTAQNTMDNKNCGEEEAIIGFEECEVFGIINRPNKRCGIVYGQNMIAEYDTREEARKAIKKKDYNILAVMMIAKAVDAVEGRFNKYKEEEK